MSNVLRTHRGIHEKWDDRSRAICKGTIVAIITKDFKFEAAHSLPNHNGKCVRLHGHSYVVTLAFSGPIISVEGNSNEGFVIDYGDISTHAKRLIEELDHQNLNDILPCRTTAENIACYLWGKLHPYFPGLLETVTVIETADTSAMIDESDYKQWLFRVQNSRS